MGASSGLPVASEVHGSTGGPTFTTAFIKNATTWLKVISPDERDEKLTFTSTAIIFMMEQLNSIEHKYMFFLVNQVTS